jgi:hypothetical protein
MLKQSNFFILVGTAKTGTTSIFHQLKEYYHIPKKETFFFAHDYDSVRYGNKKFPVQRLDGYNVITKEKDYRKLYKKPLENKGEISTCYLYYHETVIPKILDFYGSNVKIIICLRNPVDRLISNYFHFRRQMDDQDTLRVSLSKTPQRLEESYDFMWDYIGLSLYSKQVKSYLENFKNVKIVYYEDLKKSPEDFYSEILTFIEDENFSFTTDKIKHENKSGETKYKFLFKNLRFVYTNLKPLFMVISRIIGEDRFYYWRVQIKELFYLKNKDKLISKDDREYLNDIFLQDVIELEKVLGVNLRKKWRM